jgi:Mu-like prophage I protein
MSKFYYLADLENIKLDEKNSTWIDVFRLGTWKHPKWGIIKGTKELFESFIKNWKDNVVGRDISFDKTHDPDGRAVAWVKNLKIEGDRFKAFIEFTPFGVGMIKNKGFRYFSPEYVDNYESKETGKRVGPTLLGGGITNRPFLTNLSPIVLSEDLENICYKKRCSDCNKDSYKENLFDNVIKESLIELSKERAIPIKELLSKFT